MASYPNELVNGDNDDHHGHDNDGEASLQQDLNNNISGAMEKKNILMGQQSEAKVDKEKFDPQEIKPKTTLEGSSEKPVTEELAVSATLSPCIQTLKMEPELSLSGSKRKLSAEVSPPFKQGKMICKQYCRRGRVLKNKTQEEHAHIEEVADISEQFEKELNDKKLLSDQYTSRLEEELERKNLEIKEATGKLNQQHETFAHQVHELEGQYKLIKKQYDEECRSHKGLYDEYHKLQLEKKQQENARIQEISHIIEQYEKKLDGEKFFALQSTSRYEEELLRKQSELEKASEEIKLKDEKIDDQTQEFERQMLHLEELKKDLAEKNEQCMIIEKQYNEECESHKVLKDEYDKLQLQQKEQGNAHVQEIARASEEYEKKLECEKLFTFQSTSRLEEELLKKQSELKQVSVKIKQKDERIADQARELERLSLNQEKMGKELAEKNEQCKIIMEQRDEERRRHKLLFDGYSLLQLEMKELGDARVQEVADLKELYDNKLEGERLSAFQSTSRIKEELSIKNIELKRAFEKITQQTEQIANLAHELEGLKKAHTEEIACLSEQYEKKLDAEKLCAVQSTNKLEQELSCKYLQLEEAFQKLNQQTELIASQACELGRQRLNEEKMQKELADKDEQYKIIKKKHEEECRMFKVLFDQYNQLHLEKKLQGDAHCQEVARVKEQYVKKLDEEKLLAVQFTTRLQEELSSKKSELEEALKNSNQQAEKFANQARELEGLILICEQLKRELAEKNEQFKMIVMQCEEGGQSYNVLRNEYNLLKLEKKELEKAHIEEVARLNEECEKKLDSVKLYAAQSMTRLEEELASKKTELEETSKLLNQHAKRIASQARDVNGLLSYQDEMEKDLLEKNLRFKMVKEQYDEEFRRQYNQLQLEKKEEIARVIDHYNTKLDNARFLAARSSVRCILTILGLSSEMYQTMYKAFLEHIQDRLGLDWPSEFDLSNEVIAFLPFLSMESEVDSIHEGESKELLLAEPGRGVKGAEIQVAPPEVSICASFQTTPGVEVPYSDPANLSMTQMQPVHTTTTIKPISRYRIVCDYMARLQHQIESRQNQDPVLLAVCPTTSSTMMKRLCYRSSLCC